MRSILISCFVASTVLAAGCAVQPDGAVDGDSEVSSEEALRTNVTPGIFKMYDEPHHVVNACDIHTKLELARTSGGKATLSQVVGGPCRIWVEPNLRSYNLTLTSTPCGSKVYQGTRHTSQGTYRLKVTDHRTRTCKDLVPAKIITEESAPGFPGSIRTVKYSLDQVAPVVTTLEGTLVHTMGIGGENTGSSIRTETGLVELVLGDYAGQFVDGKYARAQGESVLLSGVETHNRSALKVNSLLVCPDAGTTINCMPGPNVRLSNLCAPENTSWVQAKCDGVDFVY